MRRSALASPRIIDMRHKLTILALLLAAFSCVRCAKIADPHPPELRIPKAAVDLAARQMSDLIELTVSKPTLNTNGSEATTLKRVDFLRLTEEPIGRDAEKFPEEQFLKTAIRILSIPSTHFSEYLDGKVFTIQDKPFPGDSGFYSHTFRYTVLFINNKNQSAGLSNQAFVAPVPIPPAPTGLLAEVSQSSIRLRWAAPSENMDGSKPPRIAGYNIYRAEGSGKIAPTPVNRDPVQTPEFEDLNFRFDTTYRYAVSTVGSLKNPKAESLPSKAVEVVSRDVFPPLPPKDFNAILEGGTVFLMWAPSDSTDVAGYRLYRLEKGTAVRRLVTPELIQNLSFQDPQIDASTEYQYEIRAVDTHGNESQAVTAEVEKH